MEVATKGESVPKVGGGGRRAPSSPFEVHDIFEVIAGFLTLEELKAVRGVCPVWREAATPFFAKLAPPARLLLYDPSDPQRPQNILQHFTSDLYPKLVVKVEGVNWAQVASSPGHFEILSLFKERLANLLGGREEDQQQGQGAGLKELEASLFVEKFGDLKFYHELLKFTPNLTTLSFDLSLDMGRDFWPKAIKVPLLNTVEELSLKIKEKPSFHLYARYLGKRILQMVPNVTTLWLTDEGILQLILSNPHLLPNLRILKLDMYDYSCSFPAMVNFLLKIDKPLTEIHLQMSNRPLGYWNLKGGLSKHSASLKVLNFAVVLAVPPVDIISSRFESLVKLTVDYTAHCIFEYTYIHPDYDDPDDPLPPEFDREFPRDRFERYLGKQFLDKLRVADLFKNEKIMAQQLPKLSSFQLTYNIGYKKQIYDTVFPEDAVFPQITELFVDYPKKGTPLYVQWTTKLAKLFPNVKNWNSCHNAVRQRPSVEY